MEEKSLFLSQHVDFTLVRQFHNCPSCEFDTALLGVYNSSVYLLLMPNIRCHAPAFGVAQSELWFVVKKFFVTGVYM